jgi:hypothetical protein
LIHHFVQRLPVVIPEGSDPKAHREVMVGASPLSGVPYWGRPGFEAVTQPMLFRDKTYADWCLDIAKREDAKVRPGDADNFYYEVKSLDFPD